MSFDPALGVLRVKLTGGWADVGTGGGGSVTSVTTGTPGTVTITNPTGPAVNINVTAGAGTVNNVTTSTPGTVTITNPTGPTVGIAVAAGLTSLTAGSGIAITSPGGPVPTIATQFSYARNPILEPPVSPNAYDDEFASGSADLNVRGWTMWNDPSSVLVTTRIGPIDITDSTLTPTQYRSSLKGSVLYVQWPNNVTGGQGGSIFMYKASSGAGRFAARVVHGWSDPSTTTSFDKGWLFTITANATNPFFTTGQYRQLGLEQAPSAKPRLRHLAVTPGVTVHYNDDKTIDGNFGTWGNNFQAPFWTPDTFTLDTGGSFGASPDMASAWNSAMLEPAVNAQPQGGVATAYVRAGIIFQYAKQQSPQNNEACVIYGIDFVRKMPVYAHWSNV